MTILILLIILLTIVISFLLFFSEIKEYKKRNDELDKKIESLSNQINQNIINSLSVNE